MVTFTKHIITTILSEISNQLKQFSSKGDLESIKQIFAYVNQQNINLGNVRDIISESQGKSMITMFAPEHLSPLIEAAKKVILIFVSISFLNIMRI